MLRIFVFIFLFYSNCIIAGTNETNETAKYIGNLTWELNNGITIKRTIYYDNYINWTSFDFMSTAVRRDYIALSNNFIGKILYTDDRLKNYILTSKRCGTFSTKWDEYGYSMNAEERINDGLILYSYKFFEKALYDASSYYCIKDGYINVTFEKTEQYYDDVDSFNWEGKKLIYLKNTIVVTSLIIIVLVFCFLIKISFYPLLRLIKLMLKLLTDGIAYFIGKIANEIYSAKNKKR